MAKHTGVLAASNGPRSAGPRPDPAAPGSRSAGKRAAIVEMARMLFYEHGYVGTSIDEICQHAEVSKPTLYRHFGGKEGLFVAVITAQVDAAADVNTAQIEAIADAPDLADALEALGARQLDRVLIPNLLALRRLVIAESHRFPDLGRVFFERGPGRTMQALATAFRRLDEDGRLALTDPWDAAVHFNWLVMSDPINRAMLLGDDAVPTAPEREQLVAAAVRAFLAAYGPR